VLSSMIGNILSNIWIQNHSVYVHYLQMLGSGYDREPNIVHRIRKILWYMNQIKELFYYMNNELRALKADVDFVRMRNSRKKR
jgi:hypothetical protein